MQNHIKCHESFVVTAHSIPHVFELIDKDKCFW